MQNILEKIRSKPEHTKKKIFIIAMAALSVIVVSLFLISVKNSVESAALEISSEKKELENKFVLPGIGESVSASLKDILK